MNSKEKSNNPSLLGSEAHSRVNGSASSVMRKYQQLALSIVTVISLVAFLFYKHEYDRLRYTLEYLEMFGPSPGDEGFSNALCASNVHRKLTTVPPHWVRLSEEILAFSSFWDEGNGYSDPVIRTLAVIKYSENPATKLSAFAFYENVSPGFSLECQVEKMKDKKHSKQIPSSKRDLDLKLAYIICKPESRKQNIPVAIQFQFSNLPLSPLMLIQESGSWKSVANVTAVCTYSEYISTSSLIVEFIAFHNLIGVEKFVFFGPLLTPFARKLLDKYGDEMGIFYEEATFTTPNDFDLTTEQRRLIIENDCIYRHRDTHENVIVLKINQFLIPRSKSSLQGMLSFIPSLGSKTTATISDFHFLTQRVCFDPNHAKNTELQLDTQVTVLKTAQEEGISLIRPHLVAGGFSSKFSGSNNEQHIPASLATIVNYENCSKDTTSSHVDISHLPTNKKFAEQVRKSLIFRKWKANY